MKLRTTSAVVGLAYALSLTAPVRARADELRVTTPLSTLTPLDSRLGPAAREALVRGPATSPLGPRASLEDVRLSKGAKTAIIVGAIVVGVLLIVGIVALSKPGKKLP